MTTPTGAPEVAEDGRASTGAPPAGRIWGIDVARALAILGMFAVHVGPTDAEQPLGHLYALPHGRASLLFVLVAGVGISLLAASSRTSDAQAAAKLAWRAALLLPVGLLLQRLDHGVAVILQDYALLFLLAIALLRFPDRWLLWLAVVAAPVGSAWYLWNRLQAPAVYARTPVEWGDPIGSMLHGLVLSGPYPLLTWLAPFVFGMWIGRLDLRSSAVRWSMVSWGLVVALGAAAVSATYVALVDDPTAVEGWPTLFVDAPHSQMPLWVVGSTASAVVVLGASLHLADRWRRPSWPLVATGQLALTVYVGHLVALHLAPERLTSEELGAATVVLAGFTAVSVALSTLWRAVAPRGPLELLLHLPWMLRRGAPAGRGAT